MFSSISDALEALKTVAPSTPSSEDHIESVEPNMDDPHLDSSIMSSAKFAIIFWVGISLLCVAISITIYSRGKKSVEARSTSSRSTSRSIDRSDSQALPSRTRSDSIWMKIFPKGLDEPIRWPAVRPFSSRSKSRAGDVEMQQAQPVGGTSDQLGDWTGAARNTAQTVPTLHSGARRTRIFQRPEQPRTDQGRDVGWRAEAERQRLRDAWDQLDIRAAETFQITPIQPVIPEPVGQPRLGRVIEVPLPIYESSRRAATPTPSIPEVPPPTYAQHTDDLIAYLSDYQNPQHAAEEITDEQELPPYVLSWPSAPAPVHSSLRPDFI